MAKIYTSKVIASTFDEILLMITISKSLGERFLSERLRKKSGERSRYKHTSQRDDSHWLAFSTL